MKPVTFNRRFSFSVIHPDHVAKIRDHAMRTKMYAIWAEYPETDRLTILRTMFTAHSGAARYATRFFERYGRLKGEEVRQAMVAEWQAKGREKKWWLKPIDRLLGRQR